MVLFYLFEKYNRVRNVYCVEKLPHAPTADEWCDLPLPAGRRNNSSTRVLKPVTKNVQKRSDGDRQTVFEQGILFLN
jgi:hypothetical protein